jgi:DoxX-like family
MTKRNKIIYWVATLWLALGMASSGFFQIIKLEDAVKKMSEWGYPTFMLTILGTWKILGVVAILVPKFPLVKEWAYAGFFFLMTGAIFTHFAIGDPATEFFGPSLLLALTLVSWYFRPADRRILQPESSN